jgi:hypothetical protein
MTVSGMMINTFSRHFQFGVSALWTLMAPGPAESQQPECRTHAHVLHYSVCRQNDHYYASLCYSTHSGSSLPCEPGISLTVLRQPIVVLLATFLTPNGYVRNDWLQ